jgi:hypothetical protein
MIIRMFRKRRNIMENKNAFFNGNKEEKDAFEKLDLDMIEDVAGEQE